MKRIISILILAITIGCNKPPEVTKPNPNEEAEKKAQIDAAVERRAAEIVAAKQAQEEQIAAESARLAEERAKQDMLAQQYREKVAADLAGRQEFNEAKQAATLDAAAQEKARRDVVASEVKEFVDTIEIQKSEIDTNVILHFNGELAKTGMILVSPTGFSLKWLGQEGDYFIFKYDEDAMSVTLKKTMRGLSFLTVEQKTPLAAGLSMDTMPPTASTQIPPTFPSSGLMIMKATYGTDRMQRDVKETLKSRIVDGKLNINANGGELSAGDPAPGKTKTLYVKYFYHGRLLEKSVQEGRQLSIP